MTNPPRSIVIKTGIIRTASNIDKTADHFSEDIYWLWLFGCGRSRHLFETGGGDRFNIQLPIHFHATSEFQHRTQRIQYY